MGMYDTLIFKCPKCGVETDVQTKQGECLLHCWRVGDKTTLPDGFSRLAWGCHECNHISTIEIKNGILEAIHSEAPLSTQQEMMWGRLAPLGADPQAEIERIATEFKKLFAEWDEEEPSNKS